MKLIALNALLFLAASASATVHTMCFNHFMNTTHCVVSSAAEKTRCKLPRTPQPAHAIIHKDSRKKKHQLVRRYDTTNPSFFISSPATDTDGNCGMYDSPNELGVCLWSGPDAIANVARAGWVNAKKTSNCGKRVYVQRKGQPKTVQYAKVVDGCGFNTKLVTVGCFQIGLTEKLFFALNPTTDEKNSGTISDLTWDFDNLDGFSSQQAPV